MASSEYGARVDTELTALSINTNAEVRSFRVPGPRRLGNMKTVLDNIQTAMGKYWVSRKRVRADALQLFKDGSL
mgnify:CR=1 FL=1